MHIPAPLLEKIRLSLPYGAQKYIARCCHVSAVTVHQVLRGQLRHPLVLAMAVKVFLEEQEARARTLAELRAVLGPALAADVAASGDATLVAAA